MRNRMLAAVVGLVAMLLLAGCMGAGSSAPAKLAVQPGALDFGAEQVELALLVGNDGDEQLDWSVAVGEGAAWLAASPAAGVDDGTVLVSVDREGLAEGSYSGWLRVESNGGTETVSVFMNVRLADEGEEPPATDVPDKVRNLDVRGVTMPVEFASAGATFASELWSVLGRMDDMLFEAAPFRATATAPVVERAALPAGYEAAFALSWDSVAGATGYRLFKHNGIEYEAVADVAVADLEDAEEPTYVFSGAFAVGDTATFRVQAVNDVGGGTPSAADEGIIIGAQTLVMPGNGSTTSARPTFLWEAHDAASGYILTVAAGDRNAHVWQQVVVDDVEAVYPGDDPAVGERLAAGDYLWYVVTHGPMDADGKAKALSFSRDWTFHVD